MVYLNAPYGGEWWALYGEGKRLFTKGLVEQPEGPRLNEVRTWLEATKNRGMALGLKHTKEVLDRLNLDHIPPHVLHVAGSNGKGTVCALMAASLTLSNRSNLFFSSPHLVRVEERLRLNGVPIGADRLDEALKAVHHASQIQPAIPLTFFEVTYLSAMHIASDAHVEVLILETGLGGRLDATRSGPATASLITAISGEHRDILGDSIAQIAKEKAAIARPGCPILIRKPLDEATEKAMLEEASMAGQSELGERVEPAHARLVAIPLTASVRTEALLLAKALFEEVGLAHTELETAFERLHWPARLQHLSQASTGSHPFILDAAHNPSGLKRVLPELEHCIKDAIQSKKGWTLLLGTSPQEDLASFCAPLIALCERHPPRQVVFTEPQGGRYLGVACESLASLSWPCPNVFAAPLPTEALHYLSTQGASKVGLVVSLGSLYLQGNLLDAFGLSSDSHPLFCRRTDSTGRCVRVGEPMSDKWDQRFIDLAFHISGWSKDPSTKVGCVVVGEDREIRSTGFNGFPRGISDDNDRLTDRTKKYPLICHAEENAIMHAARIGVSLKGNTAFVTWPPCSRCARSLIQAGIQEVVYPTPEDIPERWMEDFETSNGMLKEAGVLVRTVDPSE